MAVVEYDVVMHGFQGGADVLLPHPVIPDPSFPALLLGPHVRTSNDAKWLITDAL